MPKGNPHVVLAGGGTGGHVIPAIAVAKEIVRRGGTVSFVGTEERLEATLVPKSGFEIDFVHVHPLVAGGLRRALFSLASVPPALATSAVVLGRRKPDVVMGVGGYVAGPVVLAARMMGKPTAVLEQNALVGMTNRLLARVVDRAFVSYEATLKAFPRGVAVLTGNPVKESIVEASRKSRAEMPSEKTRVTVMGGSQGALAIDERVPRAMSLAGIKDNVVVVHQCGAERQERVRAAYASAGIEATVVSFIDDTASLFLETDLVVARAGATTIAELTVMGLPAILLPYPHHKDRQQERNADPMRARGAALVLDERTTGVDELAEAIRLFVTDSEKRESAATAARGLGRPDATVAVVDGIFSLAGGGEACSN